MSSQNYAVEAYGLHVKDTSLLQNVNDPDWYDEGKFLPGVFALDYGGLDFTRDDIESQFLSHLDKNGEPHSLKYNDEVEGIVLPLDKQPSLMKAAYSSMDEIVQELKESYGKYLPSDFDYESNIVFGQYVMFG